MLPLYTSPAVLLHIQVTGKIAALCVRCLQQPEPLGVALGMAFAALDVWLTKAVTAIAASPASQAAAAVRQQLQDSGLLQHLGAGMDAVKAEAFSEGCC